MHIPFLSSATAGIPGASARPQEIELVPRISFRGTTTGATTGGATGVDLAGLRLSAAFDRRIADPADPFAAANGGAGEDDEWAALPALGSGVSSNVYPASARDFTAVCNRRVL